MPGYDGIHGFLFKKFTSILTSEIKEGIYYFLVYCERTERIPHGEQEKPVNY